MTFDLKTAWYRWRSNNGWYWFRPWTRQLFHNGHYVERVSPWWTAKQEAAYFFTTYGIDYHGKEVL